MLTSALHSHSSENLYACLMDLCAYLLWPTCRFKMSGEASLPAGLGVLLVSIHGGAALCLCFESSVESAGVPQCREIGYEVVLLALLLPVVEMKDYESRWPLHIRNSRTI